jgi:hypothetical protein
MIVAPHYYKQADLDNLDDKKKLPKQSKQYQPDVAQP